MSCTPFSGVFTFSCYSSCLLTLVVDLVALQRSSVCGSVRGCSYFSLSSHGRFFFFPSSFFLSFFLSFSPNSRLRHIPFAGCFFLRSADLPHVILFPLRPEFLLVHLSFLSLFSEQFRRHPIFHHRLRFAGNMRRFFAPPLFRNRLCTLLTPIFSTEKFRFERWNRSIPLFTRTSCTDDSYPNRTCLYLSLQWRFSLFFIDDLCLSG